VAGLHDERHVDVCRNHLELDVAAGGFAPEERSAWQQVVNAGLCAGIAVVHAHPIAHAGKFDGGLGEVEEFTGQFGWHLAALTPDQVPPSVNRSDPGYGQIRPTKFAGFVRQPAIQAKLTKLHFESLAGTDMTAKRACQGRLFRPTNDRLWLITLFSLVELTVGADLPAIGNSIAGKPAPTAVAIAHPMGEMPNVPSCLYPRGLQTCFAWSTEDSRITALGKDNRNPTLEKTRSTAVIGGSGRSLGPSGYSSNAQPENNLNRQVDLIRHKPMRHSDLQQQPRQSLTTLFQHHLRLHGVIKKSGRSRSF
jgi:hypothetical protein